MSDDARPLPRLGFTCGDPAGIGPEVAVAAFHDKRVQAVCRPVLFGSLDSIAKAHRTLGREQDTVAKVRAMRLDGVDPVVATDGRIAPDATGKMVSVFDGPLAVRKGQPSAKAGRIAYESLMEALQFCPTIRDTPRLEGLVTAPLNKYSLQMAGVPFPGHTEILGQHAVSPERFAMMLHVPPGPTTDGTVIAGEFGLSIVHVTLHTSVESVPGLLTVDKIVGAIRLLDADLPKLGCTRPRIAVAALNPHGGENGLFGDEESRLIAPAIERINGESRPVRVAGPLPCDTLIRRAVLGEFDAVVAMYHDQGHIPVKLIAMHEAINITLGLPFPRTSPTHGTAYDIVGRTLAHTAGMIAAAKTCAAMASLAKE